MSATNTTPNIGLPSFIGTDKPSWLIDWNGAMSTIDTEVGAIKTDLSGAVTRIGNLENSVSSLNSTVANHTTSITNLNTQVAAQGGTINTITSLIGNGTPTTTDQTIIGAINELHADISLAQYNVTVADVVADGVKTFGQLIAEVTAAITLYCQSMPDNVGLKLNFIEAADSSYVIAPVRMLTNAFSSYLHTRCFGFDNTRVRILYLNENAASVAGSLYELTTSSYTAINTSDVPTSGKHFRVEGDLFANI